MKKAAAVGIGIAIAIVIAAGVYAMSGTLIGEPSEPVEVGVGDEVEGTIEEPEEQEFRDEIIQDVEEEIGTGIEQTP